MSVWLIAGNMAVSVRSCNIWHDGRLTPAKGIVLSDGHQEIQLTPGQIADLLVWIRAQADLFGDVSARLARLRESRRRGTAAGDDRAAPVAAREGDHPGSDGDVIGGAGG